MRFILTLPLLFSCVKTGPVETPSETSFDPVPVIIAALESGSQISAVTADMALSSGDFVGCLVGDALSAALATGASGVAGNIEGNSLPDVEVDLSDCFEIGTSPESVEIDRTVDGLVSASLSAVESLVLAYSPQMDCTSSAWVLASVAYARGVSIAVISEIRDPDGVLVVPFVDVEVCEAE